MYLNKLNLVVKHFLLPLVEEGMCSLCVLHPLYSSLTDAALLFLASKMSYLKRTDFTPLYLVLQEIVRCNMMILLGNAAD